MIYIVLGLLGAVAGSVYFHGQGGFWWGGVIGLLLAAAINQRNRLLAMEQRLKTLESKFASGVASPATHETEPAGQDLALMQMPSAKMEGASATGDGVKEPADPDDKPAPSAPLHISPTEMPSLELELADAPIAEPGEAPSTGQRTAEKAPPQQGGTENPIQRWLLRGNIVVRAGVLVLLFGSLSYYGLLNAGIFGIAWFKAWRWLNLLGFIFTFGIGSAWGLQYYRPPYFASTEPFLVLFFLFYLGIAVLFALRQPPRLKGYVDGTLVFGMPLVVLSLQVGLVKETAPLRWHSAAPAPSR